jgi:hypothetical protein
MLWSDKIGTSMRLCRPGPIPVLAVLNASGFHIESIFHCEPSAEILDDRIWSHHETRCVGRFRVLFVPGTWRWTHAAVA